MSPRGKLRARERILIVLAEKYCMSLEELEKYTKIRKNVLKVYLSRLAKEGLITRKWRHLKNEKHREYCLKTTIKEELGIE